MVDIQAYNVTAAHITQTAGVCGGKPCIASRRIRVQEVYVWYDLLGISDKKIASEYNLSLAQVHAALTYAFDHLEEIRAAIHESNRNIEDFKKNFASKIMHLPSDDSE